MISVRQTTHCLSRDCVLWRSPYFSSNRFSDLYSASRKSTLLWLELPHRGLVASSPRTAFRSRPFGHQSGPLSPYFLCGSTPCSYIRTSLIGLSAALRLVMVKLGSAVAVPGQPSNLQGVPVSASEIRLSWDHPAGPSDSIVSYELYYNESLQRRNVHVTVSPPVNTYLMADLSPDTVYHIRLSARSLRGEGVPTATIQVRTMEYGISSLLDLRSTLWYFVQTRHPNGNYWGFLRSRVFTDQLFFMRGKVMKTRSWRLS